MDRVSPDRPRPGAAGGRQGIARPPRPPAQRSHALLGLGVVVALAAVIVIAIVAVVSGGDGPAKIDVARVVAEGRDTQGSGADPFAYNPALQAQFEARAAAGVSHVLFVQSPGGVVATARRVAAFRGQIEAATQGTSVDPDLLEALVFLESAGRSQVVASNHAGAAAGLAQIVGSTGTSLLGMRIDVARSHVLTKRIDEALKRGQGAKARGLVAERARIDPRFDPEQALAGAVRYLETARDTFGSEDLALESYHMGIGNLENVIRAYTGDDSTAVASLVDSGNLTYAQLYFDSSPARHAPAWDLLGSFGDESSNYLWKLYAALEIMRLYRDDPGSLQSLADLQTAKATQEEVFHPESSTETFADQNAIDGALDDGQLASVPDDPSLGFQTSASTALRPEALAALIYMAERVRVLNGDEGTLTLAAPLGDPAFTGWAFDIAREYESKQQAEAFQFVLDRMRALGVIDYAYEPGKIHVVASSAASGLLH
jgi:hypothetical protein